jgi:hypothetical protein
MNNVTIIPYCGVVNGPFSPSSGSTIKRVRPKRRPRVLPFILCGIIATLLANSGFAEEIHLLPRSERANLLIYLNDHGEIAPVKSKADWLKRRAAILDAMQLVMGPLPGQAKRCPLDMQIIEQVDCGSYLRRKLTYASEPGLRVPAYLLIPKTASNLNKSPGILCLHPTDMTLGNQTVVGLGNTNRGYGVELAERGYIVLAPAYPLIADYQPDLKALGYQSGTMKAIWDNIRAVDLLESLPFVKKGHLGVIGHSLGGHNSVYTAAFDERLKVVVSSCGFDSFRDYQHGNLHGWTSERYMPKLKDYHPDETPFDFHELIGALAPRVCFISAPLHDSNFQYWSVDEIVRSAESVYGLYGVPGNLQVAHPDCPHDFPKEMRECAYQLFDKNLR